MNIIGLMGPKIVSLLMIMIPDGKIISKLILVFLWLLKLIIDYDAAKPGNSGKLYRLTQRLDFEVGELIVVCIQFIPAIIFLLIAILMKMWIPAISGAVATLIYFVAIIMCINDVIIERKRRGERNANTNHKK